MKYFATNIKHIRKANHLTQKEMADKLDKSPTAIANWEQGTRTPIVRDVLQICKVFGIELDALLDTDISLTYQANTVSVYEITELFKKLDNEQQKIVYDLMKSMVK